MTVARLTIIFALAGGLAGAVFAMPAGAGANEHGKPKIKSEHAKSEIKSGKSAKAAKPVKPKESKRTPAGKKKRAASIPMPTPPSRISRIAPAAPRPDFGRPALSPRPANPLPGAMSGMTSPLDLSAVKQAIQFVHKDRPDDASSVERTISDPLARKLVEWVILHGDDTVAFSRYADFMAANPSWPGITLLRRHAEEALWEQQSDPQTVIGFFADEPPLSAKGYFALARAWLTRGNSARAAAAVRAAWRTTGFSELLEAQARQMFAGLITPTDDEARMEARLYLGDNGAAMRAARHLDAAELAVAKARAAVNDQSGDAKELLAAVPVSAQHDPGYMFSLIQWLRHADRIKEAAQWMLAAPGDPEVLINRDQWWIERRLVARKLLDLGDDRTAYQIVAEAAPPPNENYRADQQFTAGWIALEFLHQPALARPHFARIAEGVVNPITLARSYYWQGRAAQALGRDREARADYEAAAQYPTAYYGQLALAELHRDDVTLNDPPPAAHRPLELARALDILYAIDEPDLVAGMAADIADRTTDVAGLAELAEVAAKHNDARTTLLIGKNALGRGLPFGHYAFPDFGVPNFRQVGPQVERCIIYSIVRQESAFNTRVVSSAHALGLMQVTPEAGRNTARKFKVPFDQRRLLSDVAYNAQLGAAELGDDINAFRGSYILAFVAYNAGPRRAEQWIQQYGDPRSPRVDPIDWIERIPITETRYYVQRVLENMQVYRARLENNSRLLIAADLRRGG